MVQRFLKDRHCGGIEGGLVFAIFYGCAFSTQANFTIKILNGRVKLAQVFLHEARREGLSLAVLQVAEPYPCG